MPELPEVEIIRRNLIPVMKNMILTDIWLHRKNLRFDFPPNFALNVRGKKITNVVRRAKYLLIELEDNLSIIAHLGMSGSFIVEDPSSTNSHKKKSKTLAIIMSPFLFQMRIKHKNIALSIMILVVLDSWT
ncbi:Formamidopyrimidine-DNA glycosylase [Candidatus Liberibacter solanacearum]|uniref:Formamidopyrimidine-DNA glycosylase n=1 Tax=Candidatus Liberibacter solanacearum TaxID=556287 RepID=A0A0F4VMT0_9HYPH|nr:Formamidopyrimidine-DNA glycosylase [Candidatus Liberibacter solanacearum]